MRSDWWLLGSQFYARFALLIKNGNNSSFYRNALRTTLFQDIKEHQILVLYLPIHSSLY